MIQVALALREAVQVEVVGSGRITYETPTRGNGEHAHLHLVACPFHPGLVDDVPSSGDCGEVAPAVVRSELGGGIHAHGEVCRVAALVAVVGGEGVVEGSPFIESAAHAADESAGGDALQAVRQAVDVGALRAGASADELESSHGQQVVVFVLEVGLEGQRVCGGEGEVLARVAVGRTRVPVVVGHQRAGEALVGVVVIYVHDHASVVSQLMAVVVQTQELVFQLQFGSDVVGGLVVLGVLGACQRVVEVALIVEVIALFGSQLSVVREGVARNDVVLAGVVFIAVGIVLIAVGREVRHLLVGDTEQSVVVAVVLRVGECEVGDDLDAVVDVVVECHTCAEAVQFLLDDGTCLVVISA